MGQRPFFGVICVGFALFFGNSSWAATIEPGQGNLSINQGQGFQPVNNRIDANVGDSVMVAPGGAATVVYDDGCTVAVQPGAVATVAPLSPCASGSYAAEDSGFNWGAVGLAAGALGAGAFGVYEATKSNNTTQTNPSPASP
jgi:hypothetical protein